MLAALERQLHRARQMRSLNLAVVNLRILLGFAFIPSGLKKLIDQPFTDPGNTGAFHEFLHAFYATGVFYQFVGAVQLSAAFLLFSQRFATLGALLMLPPLTAILVFCWSTGAYPTGVAVTLMFLAVLALLVWDLPKWRGLFASDVRDTELIIAAPAPVVDLALWQRCGAGILVLYFTVCALTGEIYRPRGIELGTPAFYLLPLIALFPVVTLVIDQRRHRRTPAVGRNAPAGPTTPPGRS